MNVYTIPNLLIGDTDESYIFYRSADELISVQFTQWNGDIITEATFTIHNSPTYREFHSTYVCHNGVDGRNTKRLTLHSLLAGSNQGRTQRLRVDKLEVPVGHNLHFCYVKYFRDEQQDDDWSCRGFGTGVPDILQGGVVKRP